MLTESVRKQKNNERARRWRRNNPEKIREINKRNHEKANTRKRIIRDEIKNGLSCSVCGENRPWCLDFHHRNPKEKDITIGKKFYSWSKKRLLEEIAKCDVLCANCHRDLHFQINNGDCNGMENSFNARNNSPACSTKTPGD